MFEDFGRPSFSFELAAVLFAPFPTTLPPLNLNGSLSFIVALRLAKGRPDLPVSLAGGLPAAA